MEHVFRSVYSLESVLTFGSELSWMTSYRMSYLFRLRDKAMEKSSLIYLQPVILELGVNILNAQSFREVHQEDRNITVQFFNTHRATIFLECK